MASNECMDVSQEPAGDLASPVAQTAVPPPLNATELKERRQRKKLRFKKLEKKLEILDRQIKKCAEAEVSLEEMDSGYSAYIKEDLLKRKFVKTWQELCRAQRVSDGIVIENSERSSYEGTPYSEVNRRVQRLLQQDEFPDYIDIVQLLDRCNAKHGLGMAPEEKGQLARKVFKEVGKIIKRSRHRDFVHHFGSHLTDSFSSSLDPAEKDEELLKELQKSSREGEKKMESIVEGFVVKQEKEYGGQRAQEGDSCSADERDEEEQQTEEEKEEEEEEIKVDNESENEMGPAPQDLLQLPSLPQEEDEEDELLLSECDASREGNHTLVSSRLEVAADSTTAHTDSPEPAVSSTYQRQDLLVEGGEPDLTCREPDLTCTGGSGSSHITSSSDVVCLDDSDDDVIILSDSDPT